MTEKSALDAINEALGAESSGAPDDNAGAPSDETTVTSAENTDDSAVTEDNKTGDESDGDTASSDEGDAKEHEITAEDGTLTTASAATGDRNPDGTFKKKQEEPKKADAVNDPIPKDLKKETRDRMQSLITDIKTKDTELGQVKQNFDYMVNGIQATGTSPEQYGEMLNWMSLFNSNDPAQQEKALELVESVAERLATLLGKDRAVGDPLKGHADLAEALRTGKISQEYAKEIARTRNGQSFRSELVTSAQQRQQQEQSAAQTLATARTDLTALEENLRATDSEYETIKAQIVGPLKPLMAAINPAQWKAKFTEAYRAAKEARAASNVAAVRPKLPTNQPLRGGKNPAGGQARQPANALEAMSGALASMHK